MLKKYSPSSFLADVGDHFLFQILNIISQINKAAFGILSLLAVLAHNNFTDGNVDNILGLMTKSILFGLCLTGIGGLFLLISWLFNLRDNRSW